MILLKNLKKKMKPSKKLTPNYHHVCDSKKEFRGKVYEPEADSFLFLDALDADKPFLQKLSSSSFAQEKIMNVLEIGVGSGVVCSHLCFHCLVPFAAAVSADQEDFSKNSFPSSGVHCIGVDINKTALKATFETWEATKRDRIQEHEKFLSPRTTDNGDVDVDADPDVDSENNSKKNNLHHLYINYAKNARLSLLHSSGLTAIRPGSVDVLLFNPPYVPTSTEEMLEAQATALNAADELPAAWAGGLGGREVCDTILPRVASVLSYPHGVAYIVALRENYIEDMLKTMNEEGAFKMGRKMKATLVVMRWTGEHLRIVRFEFES